jgi:BMFP domain-containing protein YqiC
MKPDARIFDDLSRVAGGAMNVFSAFREQILNDIKARVEEVATRMDLVPREDFERLEAQVKQLQKKLDDLTGSKKPAAKTAPPKKAVKKQGKKK